jgi:hypothetical protein
VRAIRAVADRAREENRQPTTDELERLALFIEAEAHPANVECGAMVDAARSMLARRT